MIWSEIIGGFFTGVVGGFSSGLLGITSGGILVPFSVLLLGQEQHVAQGISLVAQILPTGLSGIRNYRLGGHRVPLRWLGWLAAGFAAGGGVGALLATLVPDRLLQWTFVVYLVILTAVVILRSSRGDAAHDPDADPVLPVAGLLAIGAVAGWSSGFLGIGGGLAITALMSALLKLTQHRAQAVSLAVTALPVTLPAAALYLLRGTELPWITVGSLIVGLWVGTDLGARVAVRLSPQRLRLCLIGFIALMAIMMAIKAMR
jgi:uncharacterized membrane protein YfcA